MNDTLRFPFYAKLAFTLISLIALYIILYFGQNVIVPLLLAGLFAILLGPVTNFCKNKLKLPHVVAVFLTVLLFVLFLAGIIFFLSVQIGYMVEDWAKIKANVNIHLDNIQSYVKQTFNVSKTEQNQMINEAASDTGKDIVGTTISSLGGTLVNVVLLPIYTFLILLYRNHFIKFLAKLFKKDHHAKLQEILSNIKTSVQSYIVGLLIEMFIVSALTTIGFYIIGVEYFFLLGIITGILNLIPYVGILFAGVLSMAASLTGSPDLNIVLGVIVVNLIVQFIDNNFLVPMIVSSKVEVNALVSIVGIIIGGAIAGIAGMFLAIPLIAIMKVIFDRIEELRPWGYLMGDDLPKTFEWRRIRLPFYGADDNASLTITTSDETEPPKVIFTETTTTPTEDNKL